MTIPLDHSVNDGDILSKHPVTDGYILHSDIYNSKKSQFVDSTQFNLVASLSTNEILHFDVNPFVKTNTFKGHTKSITDIKFSRESPRIFYSSSTDGNIYAWDNRSGIKPVMSFSDDTGGNKKPLLCFDYNVDEIFLCAGTELINSDSFMLFWDRRTSKNLGGYWNSHTDDITHVQFHPSRSSGLASASVDGLINIFDLNESCEDDALLNTMNTESSVSSFSWNGKNELACITGSEDYQFWLTDKLAPVVSKTKEDLNEYSKCKVDYLVDTFYEHHSFNLASGSYDGTVHFHETKKKLKFGGVLRGGHTDTVRTVSSFGKDCCITGGEDGKLCVWKLPWRSAVD